MKRETKYIIGLLIFMLVSLVIYFLITKNIIFWAIYWMFIFAFLPYYKIKKSRKRISKLIIDIIGAVFAGFIVSYEIILITTPIESRNQNLYFIPALIIITGAYYFMLHKKIELTEFEKEVIKKLKKK